MSSNSPNNQTESGTSESHNLNQYSDDLNEIDIFELTKTIWLKRRTIFLYVAVGSILAVLFILLSTKEYTSNTMLMPEFDVESTTGSAANLLQKYGGLIGLSDGTYNSNSNAIRVDLYPKIVGSITFQKRLAEQEFYFPKYDTSMTLMYYYLNEKSGSVFDFIAEYTIGLPGKFLSRNKQTEAYNLDENYITVSEDEFNVLLDLKTRVRAKLDEETGIITISATFDDPVLSAYIADYAVNDLTEYLVAYRTKKVTNDLLFIEEQLTIANTRFESAQNELANFRDSNQGALTARAKTEEQRLNSEYNLAFNLYDALTQQYEQAKLKVQEQTPIFQVLQPVIVPVNDDMSGFLILAIAVFLSVSISIAVILVRHYL